MKINNPNKIHESKQLTKQWEQWVKEGKMKFVKTGDFEWGVVCIPWIPMMETTTLIIDDENK